MLLFDDNDSSAKVCHKHFLVRRVPLSRLSFVLLLLALMRDDESCHGFSSNLPCYSMPRMSPSSSATKTATSVLASTAADASRDNQQARQQQPSGSYLSDLDSEKQQQPPSRNQTAVIDATIVSNDTPPKATKKANNRADKVDSSNKATSTPANEKTNDENSNANANASAAASNADDNPQTTSTTMPQTPEEPKRSLYEILGAEPTETRAELKRRYVELAKLSHPDAKLQNSNDDNELDFNEIAAAWRILSDQKQRMRYDRSLQAEQFSQDIQDWAGELTRQAAPAAEMLGGIVAPFLRKTTAATVASVQAAANDLQDESNASKKKDIGSAFQNAVRAARRAGRYVDSLELLEKSQTLAERAVTESQNAATAEQKLMDIAERRLTMALHTPGSGLTSAEAMIVWEDFNQTVKDTLTTWDRAMMKHTIEFEIDELSKAELAFVEMQELDTEAQQDYQMNVQARLQRQKELVEAERAAEEAEKALKMARARVLDARSNLEDVSRGLVNAEATAKKVDYEMERRSLDLVKQSEKVRTALRVKEKEVCKVKNLSYDESEADQVSAERLKELKELRREERLLAQNSARFESKASRLLSRASKLKRRAEALERFDREKES